MNLDKYELTFDDDLITFEFVSTGAKGFIRKIIEFQLINDFETYNLAFGDKDVTSGSMNDLAVSNNGDTEKVLATVIEAVYLFFNEHPTAYVYATGSTYARTRLYRMGITKYYEQVQRDFYLYGRTEDGFTDFVSGKDYIGFLAQRKFY